MKLDNSLYSGIYIILNKITGQSYIGQAAHTKYTNLNIRIQNHFVNLSSNKKRANNSFLENKHLQLSFNKYGKENFEIAILSFCSNKKLNDQEARFIAFFGRENLYNFTKGGDGSLGYKHSDFTKQKMSQISSSRKHSQATKDKISKANKGRKHSKEFILKLSQIHKNKKLSSTQIQQIIENNSKHYKLLSPEGNIIEGKNIKDFCRNNKLAYRKLCLVLKNKRKHHKGWRNGNYETISSR